MPELPEVQTVVQSLQSAVKGAQFLQIHHLRSDIVTPTGFPFCEQVTGRRVIEITRRGKRIVFRLDDGNFFYIHLGMTGRLTIESTAEPLRKHTHLIAALSSAARAEPTYLHFTDPRRFGGIWWLGATSDANAMGPEPLTVRPSQLLKRLHRTSRPIKNALLDQKVIAGLGNIYADEALFRAQLHPTRIATDLTMDEIKRLNRAIKTVLRQALRFKGSTLRDYVDAEGNKGSFQKHHRVYDREGKPCRSCKTPVERRVMSGRSAHFCPRCQPIEEKAERRRQKAE